MTISEVNEIVAMLRDEDISVEAKIKNLMASTAYNNPRDANHKFVQEAITELFKQKHAE